MKGRHPLAPLVAPALIGVVTAATLILALLHDGPVEWLAVLALGAMVGLVVAKLAARHT
tara:strand:- start:6373 stop:6549 length:177 start_codon:yes stop_codon:yes gene_type:complete